MSFDLIFEAIEEVRQFFRPDERARRVLAKMERWEHHHRHHHHRRVAFVVGDLTMILSPGQEAKLMLNVTVGHKANFSFHFVDVEGNPMLVQPSPDATPPPVFAHSSTDAAVDDFNAPAGGLSAQLVAKGPGADSVTFTVSVGGQVFSATTQVNISAAPQVLGGVVIDATVE